VGGHSYIQEEDHKYLLITCFITNIGLAVLSVLYNLIKYHEKIHRNLSGPHGCHLENQGVFSRGDGTPEEMEEGMKAWMAWAERCGSSLVDMGSPLGNGLTLKPGGDSTSSESNIIGYSVLQADSLDEAQSLLQGHPHLDWHATCEIELHEALPAPGS
jgi:hypothetical protein